MPYLTVGVENSAPIDLHYEDHGTGQPVVLIHGFPLSAAAWEKQVAALLNEGYRTITYDRRGFGTSSQPAVGYDYDTFAADLSILINELDLTDIVLVGHSMGTGEVTRYIANYGSARVSRAIFISPIPPYLLKTEDNPEGVDQSLFDGFMKSAMADRPAYLTSFMNDFYNTDENLGKRVSEEVVRLGWNVAVNASPTGTVACIPAWLTDFRSDLPRIDVPALIIQGDEDRVLPYPVTGQRMHAAMPSSQLRTLKGAPHGIPWTHADEVNQALLEFIKTPVDALT
ncbi:alpha/beta hydrolase [Plantactinospora sp. S1510]|uniref:Alpha/beta hydrolase n=1 Tax=Plantactinospora alkalitolerans TaxID=2789879 RepID=A0ABS0H0S3_9ACTN|nr:alpha/beta hydrolase [Plantactinospora alkalitolerans]MBF9131813.1 alpha/beta hydrolase [Plantactinospora alkalitolerans]